jgi:hypothetical protein
MLVATDAPSGCVSLGCLTHNETLDEASLMELLIQVVDAFLAAVGRVDDDSNAVKEATVQWVLDHPAESGKLIEVACERSTSERQLGVIGAFLVEAFVSQPNIDLPALLEAIGRVLKWHVRFLGRTSPAWPIASGVRSTTHCERLAAPRPRSSTGAR